MFFIEPNLRVVRPKIPFFFAREEPGSVLHIFQIDVQRLWLTNLRRIMRLIGSAYWLTPLR